MKNKAFLYIVITLITSSSFGQINETGNSIFNISYPMSFAQGEFYEFIDQPGFRGIALDSRHFVSPNISAGVGFSWGGYYQKKDRQIYEFNSGAVTATKLNYLYHTTLHSNVFYYPSLDLPILPYIGINAGFAYTNKIEEMGIFSLTYNKWAFGMAPEIGLILTFGDSPVGLITYGKYNQSFYNSNNTFDVRYFQWGIGLTIIQ